MIRIQQRAKDGNYYFDAELRQWLEHVDDDIELDKAASPVTTSYLLGSTSRTNNGARTPCVLKLAVFCVVAHFVAENA